MRLEKRKPTGREKDDAAVVYLEKLRHHLHFAPHSGGKKLAARKLSWLQDDGLEILEEAVFMQGSSKATKLAAVYGLRKMHGRMKARAMAVLLRGMDSSNAVIHEVCAHALSLMNKPRRDEENKSSLNFNIKTLPANSAPKTHQPLDMSHPD